MPNKKLQELRDKIGTQTENVGDTKIAVDVSAEPETVVVPETGDTVEQRPVEELVTDVDVELPPNLQEVELPPEIDPDVNEDLRDALMTPDQVKTAIGAIVREFTAKLATVEGNFEKLRLSIEMQDKKSKVGKPKPSGIEITAISHGPVDHQDRLVKLHIDKTTGKEVLFANNKPEIRSLRRSQGWEPVLDEKGDEVRYIDGVMMTMDPGKFQEEIRKPKEIKKALRRKSISKRFHERGKDMNVETFGDITYDEGKD